MPILAENGINIEKNFADTSPTNGLKTRKPYVKFSEFPTQDPNYGDSHFYYLEEDCE